MLVTSGPELSKECLDLLGARPILKLLQAIGTDARPNDTACGSRRIAVKILVHFDYEVVFPVDDLRHQVITGREPRMRAGIVHAGNQDDLLRSGVSHGCDRTIGNRQPLVGDDSRRLVHQAENDRRIVLERSGKTAAEIGECRRWDGI